MDLLVASPIRRVVVTDAEGRVVGLVTDTALLAQATPEARPGLLQALASHLPGRREEGPKPHPAARSAGDVMLTEVFQVPAEATLSAVLREMLEQRVKRLVIVDTEGHLIGLVERQTLLEALLGES